MTSAYAILVMEPDGLLREMISNVLALHRKGVTIFAAPNPRGALEILNNNPVDLVVADSDAEEIGGEESLFTTLTNEWPEVPLVLLNNGPAGSFEDVAPGARVIPRPPGVDDLLAAVDELIRNRKDSILHGISLPSFLQLLNQDRTTCPLAVASGSKTGHIFFDRGELIHAATAAAEGREALLAILSWPDYSVRVSPSCRATRSIYDQLTGLLLDWSLLVDNRASNLSQTSWNPAN